MVNQMMCNYVKNGTRLFKIYKPKLLNETHIIDAYVINVRYGTYVHKYYYDLDVGGSIRNKNFGESVFFTKEDALAKLDETNRISIKRQKLIEYETKLNEELGLSNRIIKLKESECKNETI